MMFPGPLEILVCEESEDYIISLINTTFMNSSF